MGDSKPDAVARLVQQGLDHYGTGEVRHAVQCWREALELDPGHADAREYLEAALEDLPEGEAPGRAPDPLEEAQNLLQEGREEEALERLEAAAAADPERLDLHGYIDLARSRLLKRYRERFAVECGVPELLLSAHEVMRFDLPSEAGFLLSLVDGTTPVKDLVSLSGMDEFRALRLLARLVDQGILEVRS